jgi:hypothetical protein
MHHAVRVCEAHRLAHPDEGAQDVGVRRRAREVVQSLAPDQLHDVVDPAVCQGSDLVHRDDPGVLQPCQNAGFPLEPDGRVLGGHIGTEHLERHLATQGPVLGAIYRTHATAA